MLTRIVRGNSVGSLPGLCAAACTLVAATSAHAQIVNPSFENGLAGWIAATTAGSSAVPLAARALGTGYGGFPSLGSTTPTDGTFALTFDWDGNAVGAATLSQDITIPPLATTLKFDYKVGWQLNFGPQNGATKRFAVKIQPAGGGADLAVLPIKFVTIGTTHNDPAEEAASVDLSLFAGQARRLVFEWTVVNVLNGPSWFQMDNLRFVQQPCRADFNQDGATNVTDIFDFLTAWFAGCP